jgi:integrase/recombinase XerC/integrase/recombinase XerD
VEGNLDQLILHFLSSQDLKPTSKATYERELRQFLAWLTVSGLSQPSRQMILAFKAHLEARRLAALTISNYLVVVRRFFDWTEELKLYPNIAKGIKGARRPRGFRKDPLTVEQAKELLNSINQGTLLGQCDFALINLLIRTGIRTIEVVRANISDIRQEGGEAVLWVQGKGSDSKDEFVLLTAKTLKPILAYLDAGTFEALEPADAAQGLQRGNLTFSLAGTRLCGEFALIKMRGPGREKVWLLIKKQDCQAKAGWTTPVALTPAWRAG